MPSRKLLKNRLFTASVGAVNQVYSVAEIGHKRCPSQAQITIFHLLSGIC